MPQSLFEISEDMHALDDLLFELGGDVTDEKSAAAVEEFLKELAANLKGKADGYAGLITTMEKRAEVRKAEASRMSKRAAIDLNAAAFLKSKLKLVMEQHNLKKIETDRFRISIAGNGGLAPLTIYDEELLSDKFFIPQPDAIDKDAIRKAIGEGELVPGARIEERGTRLAIK
jgi:hypothetical protein